MSSGTFPARLVEQLESDEILVGFVVACQAFNNPQGMGNVVLAGMPAQRALPAAVIPAVLTTGNAVEVQKDADVIRFGGAESPVQSLDAAHKRARFPSRTP